MVGLFGEVLRAGVEVLEGSFDRNEMSGVLVELFYEVSESLAVVWVED